MTAKTEAKQDEFCDGFIDRLENLVEKEDRGALATLRRGLGKGVPFETYRFMPFKRTRWQEDAALIVGPLFAHWHQGEDAVKSAGEKENLGASMLDLVRILFKEDPSPDRKKAWDQAMKRVERRYGALLNCHADDLKPHLRYAVSLLKSKEVPINWRLLLRDVQQWSHEDRWVQREWARSFWASEKESDNSPPERTVAETTEETGAEAPENEDDSEQ